MKTTNQNLNIVISQNGTIVTLKHHLSKKVHLKIGMKFQESIPIEINNTIMIVGSVEHVFVAEESISEEGYIDLEKLNSTGIGGLNSYYKLKKIDTYPYARRKDVPNFD